MSISIGKRSKSIVSDIDNAHRKLISSALDTLRQSQQRVDENRNIMLRIASVLPVSLGTHWDMSYDINIECHRRHSAKVVKALRSLGYMLADATYTLRSQPDTEGRDLVNVVRWVEAVEGSAHPSAINRLSVSWVTLYRGGSKCKIVERVNPAWTTRALECVVGATPAD